MTDQRHLTWVAALATFLTSLSLSPLFQEQAWVFPAMLAIALMAVVGYALRALGLPFPAVALLQVVAAGMLLLYQFSPTETLWYGLPTWDTVLAVNDIGYGGRLVASRYATPVPLDQGIVFFTVAGIAVVTIAVDLLAVGLRLVPLAGLPLLALYTVPVAVVRDGVPWLFFVLAAGAFVGLLVAEGRDRLSRWGRSMGFTEKETALHQFVGDVQTGPVARVGRRIGAAAVCLAVAVPVVIPGIDDGIFGGGLGTGGSGGRTVITSDPVVDLRRDLRRPEDVPLFTYETDDATPDYWRLTTLETFTGAAWERAENRQIPDENVATDGIPPAPGVSGSMSSLTRTTTVQSTTRFTSPWLPLPYPVTGLTVSSGRWVYDAETRDVFGVEGDTSDLTYTVQSLELDYGSVSAGDNVPGNLDPFLGLPELPALLGTLAEEVTAGASTPHDKAAALQSWFRNPAKFSYTLEAPEGHSSDDLVAFLEGGEGYCEQFAATMALMARHLGIPARVAVGFLPGAPDTAGTWTVSTHDAHAWPELYFEELGWVRFEPTPAARTGTAPPWTVSAAGPEPTASASTTGPTPGSPSTGPSSRGLDGQEGTLDPTPGFRFPTVPALIALGLVLLALTPLFVRTLMTRSRWRRATTADGEVLAGWDVLRDRAADLGYNWTSSDTPRSIATLLQRQAGLQGDPADALHRLARQAERALYARGLAPAGAAAAPVREEVDTVSKALVIAVPRSRQWRARLLPGSTRRVVHAMSEAVADGLDWLEGLSERARTALRQRTAG